MLRRRKKSTKPDFVYKGMTAKAAQVSRVQDASHDTRVFAQVHHSFLILTLLFLRSKLMFCPCAQAIFSNKSHHYPQETRRLGDNFREGFADDKPVKKLFSDMHEQSCADTNFVPFTMCMMTVPRELVCNQDCGRWCSP